MRNEIRMTLWGPPNVCNKFLMELAIIVSPGYNATLGWQMGPFIIILFYLTSRLSSSDSWLAIACTVR